WDSNEENRIYTYRLFHYFGDPAMKIWVEKPKAITAEFPTEITCGATSLQIKNISLPNALVTLVQDGNILAKVNAVNGVADLTFGAIDNIAKAVITISAQDYDPIEKEYLVQGCTNAPLAQFSASPLTLIIGENSVVNFVDNSKYSPTSWLWNFGSDDIEFVEGTVKTSQNPQVKYTKAGQYTVMLQSTNENGSNSVSKDNYITVYDKANGASCQPQTNNLANNYGFGIQKFALAEINQSSGNAVQDGGYMDFSGTAFTNVMPGYSYDISITVGSVNPEHTKVYLDLNKDGDFSEDEMLVYFSEFKGEKTVAIVLPYDVTMGELLRLRVIDEYSGMPITDGCYSPTYGQVEDYSVVFVKGVPCVQTGDVSNLGFDGATLSAKVISDGKTAITKRGFAVANHSLPTVNDINIEDPSIAGNDFSLAVTGLTKNTKYSYRSYAINEMGISYGKEMSFQTFCDSPSEHVSGFGVSIPLSTWMALSWTDSKGDVLPWGYVIKWSDVSADAIVAPVDGVVENENRALVVAQGEEFGIVQGLKSSTKYYFKIYPFTNEGSSIDYLTEGDIPVTEGTTLNHRQYLSYTFKSVEADIKSAVFNTINNTAVRNNGYTDFTSISTAVNPDDTYSLKLSVDPGGNYKYNYCAWIDWNCDGWFDSETEKYSLGEHTGAGNLSKDILIPLNAKLGATTMRIACQYSAEPESWGKISYGSAEDYTVNVGNSNNAPSAITLSNSVIPEDATVGTEVGTLSATDVDANDELTYSVNSNEFEVKGDKLVTKVTFDFKTKSSYIVKAKATDKAGAFVEKEFTITITEVKTTSINKDLVSKVTLYPNPVKSTLQLNSSVVISRVNIVNVIGVIVYSSDINASVSTINVADLKSGMYILKAFTSEGEITKRFIKE
ncbi:MAG: T9SS type A sorting domain-containing protein, partial [Bacteroidales bacterium]|nr:T9SS type A sorting domain-containing protein [Bacteroidales bacterium]